MKPYFCGKGFLLTNWLECVDRVGKFFEARATVVGVLCESNIAEMKSAGAVHGYGQFINFGRERWSVCYEMSRLPHINVILERDAVLLPSIREVQGDQNGTLDVMEFLDGIGGDAFFVYLHEKIRRFPVAIQTGILHSKAEFNIELIANTRRRFMSDIAAGPNVLLKTKWRSPQVAKFVERADLLLSREDSIDWFGAFLSYLEITTSRWLS